MEKVSSKGKTNCTFHEVIWIEVRAVTFIKEFTLCTQFSTVDIIFCTNTDENVLWYLDFFGFCLCLLFLFFSLVFSPCRFFCFFLDFFIFFFFSFGFLFRLISRCSVSSLSNLHSLHRYYSIHRTWLWCSKCDFDDWLRMIWYLVCDHERYRWPLRTEWLQVISQITKRWTFKLFV